MDYPRSHSRGQSSLEWLITHAWSILVVLSVSAVLFYTGVFEASARAQFEGLDAAGLRPVPEHVKLYSDGVMVFTVLNARPYSVEFEWVEVAPIADSDDVIRTNINTLFRQGELGVFQFNASNLYPYASAGFLLPLDAAADNLYVDFHICFSEKSSAGGQQSSHTICGKAHNIRALDESYITDGTPCMTDSECGPCENCMNDQGTGIGRCVYYCPLYYICDYDSYSGWFCINPT